MLQVIRVGDSHSHGGMFKSSGAPHFKVTGKAVALKGDLCTCPIRGHDGCTIAEGDPHHLIGGIPVADAGQQNTCGATLQAGGTHFNKT